MSAHTTETQNHWHLDKRIIIPVIISIVLGVPNAFWWANNLANRINIVERDLAKVELTTKESIRFQQEVNERMSRVEEKLIILIDLQREKIRRDSN